MKFFFSETQFAHQPQQYMVHGRIVNPLENKTRAGWTFVMLSPERIVNPLENKTRASALIAALAECGLERAIPASAGLEPILRVHARHFVDFLRTAHADFLKLPNAGAEVLPNVHPYRGAGSSFAPRRKPRPTGILGRAGWYMGDLSAVIMAGTFSAAVASAESAVAAAQAVRDGVLPSAVRPGIMRASIGRLGFVFSTMPRLRRKFCANDSRGLRRSISIPITAMGRRLFFIAVTMFSLARFIPIPRLIIRISLAMPMSAARGRGAEPTLIYLWRRGLRMRLFLRPMKRFWPRQKDRGRKRLFFQRVGMRIILIRFQSWRFRPMPMQG